MPKNDSTHNVIVQDSFDTLFRTMVVEPILDRIPESVAPNLITAINIPVRTAILVLAYLQSENIFSMSCSLISIFLIGFLFVAHEVIDDLDGMQARKTGQYSRFGEIFDHVLDAYGVPILGVSVAMALKLGPLAIVAGLWGPTVIYYLQLTLYRRSGVFVEPLVSGARSACVGAATIVVVGTMNTVLGRYSLLMSIVAPIVEIALMVGCFKNMSCYAAKLRTDYIEHSEDRKPLLSSCGCFALMVVTTSLMFLSQNLSSLFSSTWSTYPLAYDVPISPLSLTIVATGYSTVINGQEVQNIVLDNPEAPFSNKLSLGLVTMMIGACILDQFHVSTFDLRATQVIVGTLMIIFQGMSLFRCSRSIESKRI